MEPYLSEEYSQTQGFVMVVPSSSMTAEECLEKGGWEKLADEKGLLLMILEPKNESYNLDVDGKDFAYINAATALADTRNYWRQPEGRNYIVGYEDGADLALKFTEAYLPDVWAGIVTFGDLSLSGSDINNENSIPLPVWMFVEEMDKENELVELFKEINGCTDEQFSNNYANAIFFPNPQINSLLLNDQPMSQVRYTITPDAGELNADRTLYVYDFLSMGTREVGYGNKTMRYTHDLVDWGATEESIDVDGITRSWIQYVPTSLYKTEEEKAPLLVAIHGSALNGEYFAERTEYIKLAEEYGFIILFPTGSIGTGIAPVWNTNNSPENWNDVKFISEMIAAAKASLPIDESRIYLYGHSLGGMFSQLLVSYLDGEFAAAAGTGCGFKGLPELEHQFETPFFLIQGNRDFIGSSDILTGEGVRYCMDYFTKYNNCGSVDDIDGSYRMGRFSIYEWRNDAGIPMVKYADVDNMPHTATLDGGILMFNFLSQYSRNLDGTVNYQTGVYKGN